MAPQNIYFKQESLHDMQATKKQIIGWCVICLSPFFPVTPADPDVEISLHHVQSQSHPTRRARTNTTQVNNIAGFLNIKRYFPEIVLLNNLKISHWYIHNRPWLSNNLQYWLFSFIFI